MEIVKRLTDATKTKATKPQSLIALVTKFVAPVDTMSHQLEETTASLAPIQQISILQYIWMELDFVEAVRLHLCSTWLHQFGSGFRVSMHERN